MYLLSNSRLAQLVERVTSNDEVSRSSRLMGRLFGAQLMPASSDAAEQLLLRRHDVTNHLLLSCHNMLLNA